MSFKVVSGKGSNFWLRQDVNTPLIQKQCSDDEWSRILLVKALDAPPFYPRNVEEKWRRQIDILNVVNKMTELTYSLFQ